MRPLNTGPEVTASGDPRITALGRVLRRVKLDELPELWNVLTGEMAIVGPRPEVERYVDLSNRDWQFVLRARPGLTDPVTLRLRNEELLLGSFKGNYEEFYLKVLQPYKLKGYTEYLKSRTVGVDLRVICQTIAAVILPASAPLPTLDEIASRS